MSKVLGLDIGGANLKAAATDGQSLAIPFPLWKHPADLKSVLESEILSRFGPTDLVAVVMTGELCDCFESKREGVSLIASAATAAFGESCTRFYSVDGTFADVRQTADQPLRYAAANWHGLANFCRRWIADDAGEAILIDIGSTSTDLIRFSSTEVRSLGKTDTTRIQNGELVYTGAFRTPLCAWGSQIRFRGTTVALAGELFATMRDVYVILEKIPADPDCRDTADGKPADLLHSKRRLARMLCADLDELTESEFMSVAEQAHESQRQALDAALTLVMSKMPADPSNIILSGSGSAILGPYLRNRFDPSKLIEVSEKLSRELSGVAPAYAVAQLLLEELER